MAGVLVERAFRSFQTVDRKVQPLRHDRPERVRAHVLLCVLAYYVRVAHAPPSPPKPDASPQGSRLHSFRTLLDDWATIAQHRVQPKLGQAKPSDMLGLHLERTQYRIPRNGR